MHLSLAVGIHVFTSAQNVPEAKRLGEAPFRAFGHIATPRPATRDTLVSTGEHAGGSAAGQSHMDGSGGFEYFPDEALRLAVKSMQDTNNLSPLLFFLHALLLCGCTPHPFHKNGRHSIPRHP